MILARFALLAVPLLLAAQQPVGVAPQPTANPQPTKPEDLCSVEGQVLNALTGEPLKKAQITMSKDGDSGTEHGTATDAGGHFMVPDLDPGRYYLSANRNGFARAQYGARGANSGGTPISLAPGQHTRDIVLRLTPHGVIAGRVLDEDGEPVERVQVNTMRYQSFRGKRQLAPQGWGVTDDQGEYRIFGLEPGKYYLSARYQQRGFMAAEDRTAGGKPDEDYVPTYYPGTNDPAGAVSVAVTAGSVLGGTDITLRKARTVRVRGRVANGAGEGLPNNIMVRLMPREALYFGLFANQAARVRKQDGTFELRGVTPGSYMLVAQWWEEGKGSSVRQPVDVGNNNVDNVSLLLTPGVELKGQIHVEGPPGGVQFDTLNIGLEPQGFLPMGQPNASVKQDGSFTLENVPADTYRVTLNGLTENFYVKAIRMGDADALYTGLDLTHGGSGALEIAINPNGGQVDGAVQKEDSKPAGGATILLAPDSNRQQFSLFKTTTTDQYGHFSIKGVAPGGYKLFAFEQMDWGAYQDPEFLKPHEDKGEAVAIRESSHETAQLKVIPAEAAQATKKDGN